MIKRIMLALLIGAAPLAQAAELPEILQDLGLREAAVASRDLPGWEKPDKVVVHNLFGIDVVSPLQAVAPG